jgi:hypothetical protein
MSYSHACKMLTHSHYYHSLIIFGHLLMQLCTHTELILLSLFTVFAHSYAYTHMHARKHNEGQCEQRSASLTATDTHTHTHTHASIMRGNVSRGQLPLLPQTHTCTHTSLMRGHVSRGQLPLLLQKHTHTHTAPTHLQPAFGPECLRHLPPHPHHHLTGQSCGGGLPSLLQQHRLRPPHQAPRMPPHP